ncbi:hypothetical protein, partial [Erwinia sp. MYb416]|uniref:hypothetical protein n=1 Tax=Erwinia sp. MYb416 TaxID=3108532 RepID=UPI0030ACB464
FEHAGSAKDASLRASARDVRPGGSSWFTSLPQRGLIAASTSKQKSKKLKHQQKPRMVRWRLVYF